MPAWERIFETLTNSCDSLYLMIDNTIVRAHQQAASGKGSQGSGAGAFPRRPLAKIHVLNVDPSQGSLLITSPQPYDRRYFKQAAYRV